MPMLTRQYFATSQQVADAVLRQIARTGADSQLITTVLQAGIAAVQAASPRMPIVYGTYSYQSVSGQWVREIDLITGLASPLSHFRYAIVVNMKNNLGDDIADTSTLQTFDCTDADSGIGTS